MSTLDRYRKSGGFIQLLSVLEGSSSQKREQFFGLIAQESKAWEEALRKKMLTLDRILLWTPENLTDVFKHVPHLTTAMILHGLPKEKVQNFIQFLPPVDRKKIADLIEDKTPTPAEKAACVVRLLQDVRQQITKNYLKIDKIDPELAIPEDIEAQLNSSINDSPVEDPAEPDSAPEETPLRFELPPKNDGAPSAHEFETMKRRLQQMAKENEALKQDVQTLRGKLDQIRKIA